MSYWNDLFQQQILLNAFLMGILVSIACGVTGSYVVVKRLVFISGGIAHAALGGMGIAFYYDIEPKWGAIVSAIVFAFIIGLIRQLRFHREDTIIGAMWAVGMAVGLLFVHAKPGYNADLMSYLVGDILFISNTDLIWISVLTCFIVLLVFLFHKQFLAVCFDEEFAQLQGVKVLPYYFLLLSLIAVTVVMLIQVVGIIMVIALLSLPAAISGQYAKSVAQMMLIACILGIGFITVGLWVSYEPEIPSSYAIILTAGMAYILSTFYIEMKRKMLKKTV